MCGFQGFRGDSGRFGHYHRASAHSAGRCRKPCTRFCTRVRRPILVDVPVPRSRRVDVQPAEAEAPRRPAPTAMPPSRMITAILPYTILTRLLGAAVFTL